MSDHGFQIPASPDWPWLRASFPGGILLHEAACVTEAARGYSGVGFLAAPFHSVVAVDGALDIVELLTLETMLARWSRELALEGAATVSPALEHAAMILADSERLLDPLDGRFWRALAWRVLGKADAVLVPPVSGWDECPEVWRAATTALTCNRPVFLMAPFAFGIDRRRVDG